ncbi:YadA family autotransporter adhesin [Actinobacillus genomosp. 1]|uniref:YadA family autotransporter adhesin n=1 Tax=Actinobacillus genomosp. 1 TaxID=254839 RepID=UPI002442D271|nr:YadA-like family protein [Actinobacillus genomosp. 1]WGE90559.1 YadA-like family protein [Actinobacillus genomosp. 1]
MKNIHKIEPCQLNIKQKASKLPTYILGSMVASALVPSALAAGTIYGAGKVNASNGVAIGGTAPGVLETTVNGNKGIAIAANGGNAEGEESIAIGNSTNAKGTNSTVIGLFARSTKDATDAVALGRSAAAKNINTVAIGNTAAADGQDGISIGTRAKSDGNGIAMGLEANAKKSNSIAIGNGAKTEATDAVAIGNKASSHMNSVVIGSNTKGYGKYNTVIGDSASGQTEGTTAIGYKAEAGASGGAYALAAGYEAKALNSSGVAVGYKSKAQSQWSVAIGQGATAGENNENQNSQIAIGLNAGATGDDAIAVGLRSKANGEYGISLGADNKNDAKLGVIIGRENEIKDSAKGTIVLGHSVKNVTNANNVILGNESADSAKKDLADAVEIATEGKTLTYSSFKGTAAGVVSVGAAGKERQIHHVALGEVSADSTDAINGSQLYSVALNAANTAATVVKVLGGNANVATDGKITMTDIGGTGKNSVHEAIEASITKVNDGQNAVMKILSGSDLKPNGKLEMSNIGGTGKDNVNDAIKAAITQVTQGKNITVESNKGANGETIYTVKTTDDVTFDKVTSKKVAVGNIVIDSTTNQITGVEGGDISVGSKAVVNGSQLNETNQNVETNKTNIAKGLNFADENGNTYNAQLGNTVTVKGDSKNITSTLDTQGNYKVALANDVNVKSVTTGNVSMSANGINAGGTKITNVAQGVNDNDAVNVSQLKATTQKINQNINHVKQYAADNRKRAKAGSAAAIAHGSIPQVVGSGRSSLGIATGGYGGQSAIAVGYSRSSNDGKHVIKLSAGQDKYQTSYGAGYSYQW